MKNVFRQLIIITICCVGLCLSGYSYANEGNERNNHSAGYYNAVGYQKLHKHGGRHCKRYNCWHRKLYNYNGRYGNALSYNYGYSGHLTTSQTSAIVGAGVGAALGAGIGAIAGDPGLGAWIGAGAGALGGVLVGDHIDKEREEIELAQLDRQFELERISNSGQGKDYVEGHYEYVKKRNWVDTSKKDRVWVGEHYEGDRRIEGHYENRLALSGHWQEYEEKIWVPSHYE